MSESENMNVSGSERADDPVRPAPEEGRPAPEEGRPVPEEGPGEGTAEACPPETEGESAGVPEEGAAPAPLYRWTYGGQAEYEEQEGRRRRRRGVLTYALIMTGAFAVSLGLLIAVLAGAFSGLHGRGPAAVDRAMPSVVVIETRSMENGKPVKSLGSGIIMTEDGYIATNHHLVENASHIRVTLLDGTRLDAETVGSSAIDDLAVIRVERDGLTPASFADSSDCYVGQTVYAIGAPVGKEFAWTTTKGIISYKDREVRLYNDDHTLEKKLRLLQTDANVNPGNSGGPLINEDGEVVGIISMKLAGRYDGINFAIPSDGAVEILTAIMEDGNADRVNSSLSAKRPVLGIVGIYVEAGYYRRVANYVQSITEEEAAEDPDACFHAPVDGIYVTEVSPGSGAAGKLIPGDVILSVENKEIISMEGLMALLNDRDIGDAVRLTVYRDGQRIGVLVTLTGQNDA